MADSLPPRPHPPEPDPGPEATSLSPEDVESIRNALESIGELDQLRDTLTDALRNVDPRIVGGVGGIDPTVAALDVTICGSKCA